MATSTRRQQPNEEFASDLGKLSQYLSGANRYQRYAPSGAAVLRDVLSESAHYEPAMIGPRASVALAPGPRMSVERDQFG